MHGIIEAFLTFIQLHKELGYLAMFLISLLESVAFVGEVIPGTTLLIIIGAMAAKGLMDPEMLIVASSLGAIAGDVFSFWLGRKGEGSLGRFGRFVKPEYLEKGREFVKRHGSKSILLGRFIGPLRPIVPFVTGLFSMSTRKFIIWDSISAVSWSMAYIYLGNALWIVWEFAKMWSTRGGVIVLLLITIFLTMYLLRKYIAHQSMVFLMHTGNAWDSLDNYLKTRSSGIIRFLGRRIDRNQLTGLKLTLALLIFTLCLAVLTAIVIEVIGNNAVPDSDLRIDNYLNIFRTPGMVEFFSWIGVLGNIWAVMTLAVVVMVMMWLLKEPGYIFPMWVGIAGSYICNFFGGMFFRRPVPAAPAVAEHIYYFPSAYASVSLLFYGYIIYFVISASQSTRTKLNTVFLMGPVIILIGISRIYLGLHYFTDIKAGWALGMLWLILSVMIAEYLEYSHPHGHIHAVPSKIKALCAALAACWIVLFLFFGISEYSKIVHGKHVPFQKELMNPEDIFNIENLPRYTESLFGEKREPVNIIITAANIEELKDCMGNAGWHLADASSFSNVLKRSKAIITNENYYNSPVTSAFWRSRIQDVAFEKPALKNGIAEMHWVRLWKTGVSTSDKKEIFTGSASYDISLGSKLMHQIKPDIDRERDELFSSLYATGAVDSHSRLKLIDKVNKKKLFGWTYFTDGMAVVIVLKKSLPGRQP
jgi:membrane protein DedA with SNARE-associated domain/membrane-associated phospholipid phosphatase